MKVAPLSLTLCNPMDHTVYGILQARILEWVAVPFSRGSSQPRDRTQVSHIAGRFFTIWATGKCQRDSKMIQQSSRSQPCLEACTLSWWSHVQFFETPWTAAHQALLSMGFSRQEYWSGSPYPPLGDLPDPGIEPVSLMFPALTGGVLYY